MLKLATFSMRALQGKQHFVKHLLISDFRFCQKALDSLELFPSSQKLESLSFNKGVNCKDLKPIKHV